MIKLIAIEHHAQRRECARGAVTRAAFPAEATAPTCYGPGVAALAVYLLGRQHLPVERAAECLEEAFGAAVSTGWLSCLLPNAAARLDGFLAIAREQLAAAQVAHFDETGGRVAGRLHWIHVACNDTWTLFHLDRKRGRVAMDAAGVLPDFRGVAIHDGLVVYRQYDQALHGLCNAHHLRELAGIAELTGQAWPTRLAELLVELHVAVEVAKAGGNTKLPTRQLAGFGKRYYDMLIAQGKKLNPPPPRTGKRGRPAPGPAGSLLARLESHRADVLRFATDFVVPFDNNQAERDVRMVKLQQKFSGGWRSDTGAEAFPDVRSYLGTARKHGQSAMAVLRDLFTGQPWIPGSRREPIVAGPEQLQTVALTLWRTLRRTDRADCALTQTASMPSMAAAMNPFPGHSATRVVVVGQGYVGLPLAVAASGAGCTVVGIDLDPVRVDDLNAGRSPVGDISDEALAVALSSGRYLASTEFQSAKDADVVVLCVPTPYHNDAPDLSYIQRAAREVGEFLGHNALVILESTTYPGTTEEVLLPTLEAASGLTGGVDLQVAFSPERIDPGNPTYGLHNTPKIVGGLTPEATARAAEFYGGFVETVIRVSAPKAAEMAKLLENTFRHINIALVNELAILCQVLDIDVWEVIDAAASKPFGFMPFYPGPGVGGHCIPVDPMYLSWRVKQFGAAAKFIDLARDVNASMPAYVVQRVQDLLNDRERSLKGARILILGVAYKPNISDMRESPALSLIDQLKKKGAIISYSDPYVPTLAHLTSVALSDEVLAAADCVIVVTPHLGVDYSQVVRESRLVFDTRNAVGGPSVHRL